MSSSILDDLNAVQREAAVHLDGPLLIFAGAGSGKTRTLTYRIAYLIKYHHVNPQSILAVTFTNKAAREMRERIEMLIGGRALAHMWVGTFHATCARILRERGDNIGLDRDFVIYDEADQIALVRECLQELCQDDSESNARRILHRISPVKEQLVLPDEYPTVYRTHQDPAVAMVYPLYQRKLRECNALDFDDLILYTVHLLEQSEAVRCHYQTKFTHVLVDEYQDINYAQFQFVKLIADAHRNICCVGDDDQSIYSWRGADVGIILSFQKHYPDAKVVTLEQNYRSTRNILDAAYHVISKSSRRAPKQLWTDRPDGKRLGKIEAVDEHDEAVKIVNRIRDAVLSGERQYSDFVILYRTNAQSRVFEEALINYRVPYHVVGGVRFYERKEIKDLLAYLRVVFNPRDSVSLRRILNVPHRGIGPVTLQALEQFAESNGISLFEAIGGAEDINIQPKPARELRAFAKLIEFLSSRAEEFSVGKLLEEIIENTGYLAELKREGTREADSRVENVQELFSVVADFESGSEDKTLRSFLEQVSLFTDIDTYDELKRSVVLMTIHSAKGLEFPVVFIAGMEEGVFPHIRSMGTADELDEERRLCYVGMTRAKDELYLSYAYSRSIFGGRQGQVVSRFIRDIPDEAFEPRKRESADVSTLWPKESTPRTVCLLKEGDYVKHSVFGLGIVESLQPAGSDMQIVVTFEEVGRKKLLFSYAGLEKVEIL